MKFQNTAAYVLAASAGWIALSFAFIFGVFFERSLTLMGLLRLDDVIVASAGALCLIVAVFIPLTFSITNLMFFRSSKETSRILSKRPAIIAASAFSVLLILLNLALKSNDRVFVHPVLLIGIAACLLIFVGANFDHFHDSYTGRVLSTFVSAILMAFTLGSTPHGRAKEYCVFAVQNDRVVAEGFVFLSSSSGIFLEDSATGRTTFLASSAFDRLDARACSKNANS